MFIPINVNQGDVVELNYPLNPWFNNLQNTQAAQSVLITGSLGLGNSQASNL